MTFQHQSIVFENDIYRFKNIPRNSCIKILYMKFYETHFEDYCKSWDKLHENEPEAEKILEFPAKTPQDIIVYGSSGVGKYTHVLSMLRPYSPSGLKHDKKIKATTDKQSYTYRISDIHYEVDMSLLGCNSKIIWHEIYSQIVDIVTIKPEKMGFIVCKNFHAIHNELLEIFYSYMQQHCYGYEGKSREVQIYFVLITEHVSFLPNPLLEHCHIVRIPRPSRQVISSFAHIHKSKDGVDPILNTIETEHIINIKEVYSFSLISSLDKLPTDHFNMVCDTLIQEMILIMRPSSEKKEPVNECGNAYSEGRHRSPEEYDETASPALSNKILVSSPPTDQIVEGLRPSDQMVDDRRSSDKIVEGLRPSDRRSVKGAPEGGIPNEEVVGNNMVRFRDCLYDILIYNLDGLECIWYILQYFVHHEIMDDSPRMSHLLYKLSVIFKQFGNNYRSIFHLENAIFSMMSSKKQKI